ncbi:6-carboxytetrahydropterin synthase [Ruficoccus amylovorans]|uniref:6-carboxy-5,6,7,8-tetrahydropterin synthase n=1 Tax=Ruficoccus amylovorans TaxID=1804625 RepID=A0A842HC51_9BACT|nr:6-carboxytetrahydropterin synthase [Ruficoccus amylovorans]MBC2594043.1 6-carboxytetrahydropterin synthase [Ruficoccus amylovorans]
MPQLTTLELAKEHFKFSAGHFTIFSATDRENLHGHNWQVGVEITAEVGDNGLTFDYAVAKRQAEAYCAGLNERFLLPGRSPYLRIEETETGITAIFGDERLPFLRRDVLVLPLRNVTVEELSGWLLGRFCEDLAARTELAIHAITVKVYSGPGQCATSCWQRP